jgi:hypothetical protein
MKKIIRLLNKLFPNIHIGIWISVNDEMPPIRESVLITSGDGTIIDVAQWYKDKNGKIGWQQGGLSSELIPEHRNAKYWMFKPTPPKF